jgi:hypothetical protein
LDLGRFDMPEAQRILDNLSQARLVHTNVLPWPSYAPVRGAKCSPHPDAPHGFNRNGSHNAGRYVCDCEGWAPPEQSK